MDNSRFVEQGTKKLAELQPKLVNKNYLVDEIKDKMKGLDKAKNYNRWKALSECLTLVEKAKEY